MIVQPALEPLRRWDPERIGPYALLGRLGAGAMGQVYLGRSTAGRLVAVKTIKIEFAEEAGFRARFAQEVAAARRVSGVFTAAVVAADPEADMPWLATACLERSPRKRPASATLLAQLGPFVTGPAAASGGHGVRAPAEHHPAALRDPEHQSGGRGDASSGGVAGLGRHKPFLLTLYRRVPGHRMILW
jgi:hypothetical protein